jgi:hypothetical protein
VVVCIKMCEFCYENRRFECGSVKNFGGFVSFALINEPLELRGHGESNYNQILCMKHKSPV